MDIKHFALAVKEKAEDNLDRIITVKQMEYMWKELKIEFLEDSVKYNDLDLVNYTTRDEIGVVRIANMICLLYNWYDILAGSPEPIRRAPKFDLNTMC